jgi:general secretion pathway protein L
MMKVSAVSTLTLRLPSRNAAKSVPDWRAQPLAFALTAREGKLLRSGAASLPELAPQLAQVQRVVLLLAASDVTLLRMPVPPLSAARLKAALPALVEDRLITDAADCVLVATPEVSGMRSIAVIERDWLQAVVASVRALGARQIVALPLQLALPLPAQGAAATVTEMQQQIDLAVRVSAFEGMGLPMVPLATAEGWEVEVCRALLSLAAQQQIVLSVPAARVDAYRHAAQSLAQEGMQIRVEEENWQQLAHGADRIALDLMAGLEDAASKAVNWQRWRWPLVLAACLLLLNVLALNWDWWRLKSEAGDTRAAMLRTYKNAFPADSVVIDPLAQARQKIAIAQRRNGQAAPHDFIALAATMGEAWAAMPAAGDSAKAIAALSYRDATLSVRFKAGVQPSLAAARSALAARHASVVEGPAEGESVVWLVRSTE